MYSSSGVTAAVEATQQQATLLAIDEINAAGGVMGRELLPMCVDPAGEPRRHAALAEALILEREVRLIMGCYMSSARKAVVPVVERHNALLFYATPYEGFEYSRNVFYAGAAPNQNILPLAAFMLATHGTRVAMVGSDYICPHESNRVMNDMLRERGGHKVSETYLPLDADDAAFAAVAAEIKSQQPDFIFSTVVGIGIGRLHGSLARAGIDPHRIPVASHMANEVDVRAMGADLAEGLLTCASYFQPPPDAPVHRAAALHRQRHGDNCPANTCWEAAYFQMHLLALGMQRAESTAPALIARALPGLVFDAPQGRVRIDERNNHTDLNPRIARCDRFGRFEVLAAAPRPVPADPYVVSHEAPDWTANPQPQGAR